MNNFNNNITPEEVNVPSTVGRKAARKSATKTKASKEAKPTAIPVAVNTYDTNHNTELIRQEDLIDEDYPRTDWAVSEAQRALDGEKQQKLINEKCFCNAPEATANEITDNDLSSNQHKVTGATNTLTCSLDVIKLLLKRYVSTSYSKDKNNNIIMYTASFNFKLIYANNSYNTTTALIDELITMFKTICMAHKLNLKLVKDTNYTRKGVGGPVTTYIVTFKQVRS